jgi:DNA helicase HerA-like ATPase
LRRSKAGYRKTAFQGLVSGAKGQGKSTIVNAIARGRSRVIVFDQVGEYGAKGFASVHSIQELQRAIKAGWRKGFRIAFVPTIGAERVALSNVSQALCAVQRPYYETPDGQRPPIPKVLLIVEEMNTSFPSHVYDGWFAELCSRGRHYGVDVLGTTQRPAEVSTRFRGTCDVQWFFAHHDHVDVKTIGQMVGPAHAARISHLKPHEYMCRFRGAITYGKNALR